MKKTILYILLGLILIGTAAYCSYNTGYSSGLNKGYSQKEEESLMEKEYLYNLNRSELEHLDITGDRIYVIGHKSPDPDTVISAITYSRLLNALGYNAIPVTAEKVDVQSEYILKQAKVEEPEILYDASGLNIFLVDHNEYAQAVDNLVDAHIVGIVDHHAIGSVTTGNVVYENNRPNGATCTTIWLTFLNYGIEIDQNTAYLLLCGVLSDTGNLVSSLTTEADREAVAKLKVLAEVEDVAGLYKSFYAEKLSYKGMSDLEILLDDYKQYESGGVSFGIACADAIDEEMAAKLAERLKAVLPEGYASKDVDLMYAEVGIRFEGVKIDYIVPCNEYAEKVFTDCFPDYDEFNGTAYIFRSGLGRKTKFVPAFTDFLASYPHE